jgi:hypothetical protein
MNTTDHIPYMNNSSFTLIIIFIALINLIITNSYFECQFLHLEFIKCHSLLHTAASRSHHQATINWRKSLHCVGSHVNITMLILYVVIFDKCMLFLHTGFTLCSLCMVFLGQPCVSISSIGSCLMMAS